MTIKGLLDISKEKWNDWEWQMGQKSIYGNPANLKEIGLLTDEDRIGQISLTPYNVKLLMELKEKDQEGFRAEWLQSFGRPVKAQKHRWVWAKYDLASSKPEKLLPKFLRTLFWGKGSQTEFKGLENFYPETDVVLASMVCARNCAQCFRQVGDVEGEASCLGGNMEEILQAVQKIIQRRTPHVLITGGDPLTRENNRLSRIIEPLVNSETVQVIRLGTRMPVDLPMRFFNKEFLTLLKEWQDKMRQKGGRLLVDVQINHPAELTSEAVEAIRNIQDCGLSVIAQTAIFKGINDNVGTLRKLFMELDRLGVQPYKIFHAMPVPGREYLRVPLRKFRKLLAGLHQWIPGTSMPQANIPTLVGKIPIQPAGRFAFALPFTRRIIVRGFRGELYLYKDAMDWIRRTKEMAVAMVIIVSTAIAIMFWPCQPQIKQISGIGEIKHIAVLANKLDYPDAWARQNFRPYICQGTLYVPLNMRLIAD